ncbi:hypothetical protein HKX48_004936 [Thoreauomyces humboldtii]|nr:hypothetical protein HKX48_004936 [Thoreauomyces humboldtii]
MSSDVSSDEVSGVVRKRKARQRTDFLDDDDDDPVTQPSKLPKKCKASKQLAPVSHEVTHKQQTNYAERERSIVMASPPRTAKKRFTDLTFAFDSPDPLTVKTPTTSSLPPECPQCLRPLPQPFSKTLARHLRILRKPFISSTERSAATNAICRIHIAETRIIPSGISKGYPQTLDASSIGKRVKRLTVPLFNIIKFVAPSHFRKRALAFYKEVGERRAQGAEGRLKAVAGLSCGYYGTKGGRAISEACFDIFMRAKDGEKPLLTNDATSPLPPIEFLQDVLVPEAAVMLIMEDQKMDWHCAHALLNESAEYGTAMFPDDGDVGGRGSWCGSDSDEDWWT